jgi:hypothetical protein
MGHARRDVGTHATTPTGPPTEELTMTETEAGGTSQAKTRKEMEQVMAQSFGYDDYESFRTGVVSVLGKGGLKKLEKELDKYGPPEQTPHS